MNTLFTVAQIKRLAKENGSHFFDTNAMRFFNSRVLPGVYPIDNGTFFVTSESDEGVRAYTVRLIATTEVDGIAIRTVGEFMEYASAQDAKTAARNLAKNS